MSRTSVGEREQQVLDRIETARAKPVRFRDARITMAHGAGGKAGRSLVEGLLVPAFGGAALAELDDAGRALIAGVDLVMSTDSFVVRPLRFPGGSIGELAINGTANDVAMAGARPVAVTVALILEEGLDAETLQAEVQAMATAARLAGVEIVAGDTKVVERGKADGMYIVTTGVGARDVRATLSPAGLRPGDRVLLSGPVGAHGMAVMLARGEFDLDGEISSDTRSLWPAVDALLDAAGPSLRCLRDATRGGVASVLNELVQASRVGMVIRERDVPVDAVVAGAAEILGIDPMHVANEGVMVVCVAPEARDEALEALRAVPGGERAVEIGEVRAEPPGMVLLETAFGGRRVLDQLVGDPLPRIC